MFHPLGKFCTTQDLQKIVFPRARVLCTCGAARCPPSKVPSAVLQITRGLIATTNPLQKLGLTQPYVAGTLWCVVGGGG